MNLFSVQMPVLKAQMTERLTVSGIGLMSSRIPLDIRTLDETDEEVFNSIYYKEVPVFTGDLDGTLIVPSYTRTEITDSLHKTFGFRTDYEFIKKSTMRSIIK